MKTTITTFDAVNRAARPYPSYLLPKEGTVLSLFSAGFLGWNDCIHFARAGLTCECVDTDADKLWEMASLYPSGWAFHVDDAWDFAERAAMAGRDWDVVSVDPFFGDAAEKAWQSMYLWVTLATKLVTLTVKPDTKLNTPEGWVSSYYPRSSGAAWMVMRRG
jgi:hypothetical protein